MSEPHFHGKPTKLSPLNNLIFMSRWLQLPLYLGLILAQCVYVFHFWVELTDLIGAVLGNPGSLNHILDAVATPARHATDGKVVLDVVGRVVVADVLEGGGDGLDQVVLFNDCHDFSRWVLDVWTGSGCRS